MTRPQGSRDLGGYVDGSEACALAGALYRSGESTKRMAEVTGLGHATIIRIAMGEAPRLQPRTAEAALRLRSMLGDAPTDAGRERMSAPWDRYECGVCGEDMYIYGAANDYVHRVHTVAEIEAVSFRLAPVATYFTSVALVGMWGGFKSAVAA